MKNFFKQIKVLLERLSLKPQIGGLQIADTALIYARTERDKPLMFSVKLLPGIIQDGKVQREDQFAQALVALHEQILPGKSKEIVRLIVSLPSVVVYTQTFTVPNIGQEKLGEAASLNLQMLTPITPQEAYMDWQVIDERPDQYELLGAFVEKKIIDQFQSLLGSANFQAVTFEFSGLALARLVRSVMRPVPGPVLFLQVSSEGLGLFILINGALYFDYFLSWRSIAGEKREITKSAFEAVIVEEVRRVINFTLSRFKEKLEQTFVIAPGFDEELQAIFQNQFGLKVTPFVIQALQPTWFIALGSALRSGEGYQQKKLISLGTEGMSRVFFEEQLLHFIRLWRNIIIGVLAVFLIIFSASALFLIDNTKDLARRLETFKAKTDEAKFTELKKKAEEFNQLVSAVTNVKKEDLPWHQLFDQVKGLALANRVTIEELQASAIDAPIYMKALAPDNATVIVFKNVLSAQPNLFKVELSLSSIAVTGAGAIGFDISFQVKKPEETSQ